MRTTLALLLALAIVAGGAALHRLWTFGAFAGAEAPATDLSALPDRLGDPDRPLRVSVLGTSLSHRGDWPARLETRLEACRAAGAEVRRIARPGASIRWGAEALSHALEGPPDLLLMEFTINDASLVHGVPLARARALLDDMLARAGAAEVPVLLLSMNPAWGREFWERPGHAAHLALYGEAARAGRAGVLDTLRDWEGLAGAERRALVPDGLHPTAEAMARVQLPPLEAALAPRVCDPG